MSSLLAYHESPHGPVGPLRHVHALHPAPCPRCESLDGFLFDPAAQVVTLYCHSCRAKWRKAHAHPAIAEWGRRMPDDAERIAAAISAYPDVTEELHERLAEGRRFSEGEWQTTVWPGRQRPAVCPHEQLSVVGYQLSEPITDNQQPTTTVGRNRWSGKLGGLGDYAASALGA